MLPFQNIEIYHTPAAAFIVVSDLNTKFSGTTCSLDHITFLWIFE